MWEWVAGMQMCSESLPQSSWSLKAEALGESWALPLPAPGCLDDICCKTGKNDTVPFMYAAF